MLETTAVVGQRVEREVCVQHDEFSYSSTGGADSSVVVASFSMLAVDICERYKRNSRVVAFFARERLLRDNGTCVTR